MAYLWIFLLFNQNVNNLDILVGIMPVNMDRREVDPAYFSLV